MDLPHGHQNDGHDLDRSDGGYHPVLVSDSHGGKSKKWGTFGIIIYLYNIIYNPKENRGRMGDITLW